MIEHDRTELAPTHCRRSRDLPQRFCRLCEQLAEKDLDFCRYNRRSRPPLERHLANNLDEPIGSS
jgi:hypothetical protein